MIFTARAVKAAFSVDLRQSAKSIAGAGIMLALTIGFAVLAALSPVIALIANATRITATIHSDKNDPTPSIQ